MSRFLLVLSIICLYSFAKPIEVPRDPPIIQQVYDIFRNPAIFKPSKDEWGQPIQRRTVFGKSHGCVKAKFVFEFDDNLPAAAKLRKVFRKGWYPAWMRFSNDNLHTFPDTRAAARGASIKLVGISGKKLLEGAENAVTQDFILQNYPVFFVDNAEQFRHFLDRRPEILPADPEKRKAIEEAVKKGDEIGDLIDAEAKKLADPLDGTYYSVLPIGWGTDKAKTRIEPCVADPDAASKPMTSPNFLRENLITRLGKNREECFRFSIQLQEDQNEQPLDKATKEWKTRFYKFAKLIIPAGQDITQKDRIVQCEGLSMNVWHARKEFEPQGSIQAIRRHVYRGIAHQRREYNQEHNPDYKNFPLEEPTELSLD